MAYIYKITNKINGKMYIGKTEETIEKRFKQHCQDCHRQAMANRPLYRAMNKYGIENFVVEEVEKTDNPEEREIYWIEFYRTFKHGYNATMGGDGKKYIDYDVVIATYKELQNAAETARVLGICSDTVRKILKTNNIQIIPASQIQKEKYGKPVNMYSLSGDFLQSFPSTRAAAEYMIDNKLTGCKMTTIKQHIKEVCCGQRQTAAKFKWKYPD